MQEPAHRDAPATGQRKTGETLQGKMGQRERGERWHRRHQGLTRQHQAQSRDDDAHGKGDGPVKTQYARKARQHVAGTADESRGGACFGGLEQPEGAGLFEGDNRPRQDFSGPQEHAQCQAPGIPGQGRVETPEKIAPGRQRTEIGEREPEPGVVDAAHQDCEHEQQRSENDLAIGRQGRDDAEQHQAGSQEQACRGRQPQAPDPRTGQTVNGPGCATTGVGDPPTGLAGLVPARTPGRQQAGGTHALSICSSHWDSRATSWLAWPWGSYWSTGCCRASASRTVSSAWMCTGVSLCSSFW